MNGVAGIGQLAGEHAIAHDAQGILVGAPIHRPALRLLGRHVMRRADDHAGSREPTRRLQRFRDSEIGQHHAAVVVEHDVGRLHVAMHDAALVCVAERARRFPEHALDVVDRQLLLLIDHVLERRARDVLHHEVVEAAFALDAVDRDDVRVVELRRRLRFLLEALDDVLVHRDVGREHLDGDFALERQVMREEHRPHAAFSHHPVDAVLPLDEALQPLHQTVGAGAGAERAAAGHVGAAGQAELATVRQGRVTLDAFHRRSGSSRHGRARGTRNELRLLPDTLGEACGRALLAPGTAGPGRMRLQVRTPMNGTCLMHMEYRIATPA